MLSAIELYNKPNFQYREETFAILAVNAWELLFKAQLLKVSKYKMASLYELESVLNKNGQASTRKKPKTNRSGNPITIGIFDVINRLKNNKIKVSQNLVKSIESIVELRDNAIHFHNSEPITKELQELGFACIKNYMHIIKEWKLDIDLSKYNFYLMPLAYVLVAQPLKNSKKFLQKLYRFSIFKVCKDEKNSPQKFSTKFIYRT